MMMLEGAVKLFDNDDYIIYTMNSISTGQYGVVVPKNINGVLNMLIDLHFKNSFDAVNMGNKTTDLLINEIGEEYSKLRTRYADGMLVIPMMDETSFQNVIMTGDKQKMFDEVKKISAITSELYKKLTDSGVSKQKIDQKIIIVEKNDVDKKFVAWLKEQMPSFVDGVIYSELNKEGELNSSAPVGNSLFGSPVSDVSAPVDNAANVSQSNNIFDSTPVAPVIPDASVVSVQEVSPVVSEPIVAPINPLATDDSVVPVAPVQAPEVSNVNNTNDIFGAPVNNVASVPSTPAPTPVVPSEPVISNLGTIAGPKPVESTNLEGTMIINPVESNNSSDNNVDVSQNDEEVNPNNSNKGFVNLIILVVILVGVTIISIELGKFLYNVYGA